MNELQPIDEEIDLFDFHHPRTNWSKPSMALVASDGDGNGCVLFTAGPHVAYMIDGAGRTLGNIGLDDAPDGISVWTGKLRTEKSYEGEHDEWLEGVFRDPTDAEIARYVFGDGEPWDRNEWVLPEAT